MSLALLPRRGPDRQTHAHRCFARKDVAEIAGGNDETRRLTQFRRRGDVINALRNDADEIDRIYRGERMRACEIAIREKCLHQRLRIVECSFQRDVVDIRVG
jgi:hypothetical protein